MANGTDAPYGFLALKSPDGTGSQLMEVVVAANNDEEIARGDSLVPISDGTVSRAAAGEVIVGVAEGCKLLDADGLRTWQPWMDDTKAGLVNMHWNPNQLYAVQGGSGALALTDMWQNANHVDADPNQGRGVSQQYLGTITTTSTLGWKIVNYRRGVGGTNVQGGNSSKIGDTYANYVVICNRRYLADQITGI